LESDFLNFIPKEELWPYYLLTHIKFNVEKDEEMNQMQPSNVGGGGGQMVKTKNHPTLGRLLSNTPKKVFESCSIAFMVQRLFVDHKVALL
jgi:hypothetical protein